MSVHVISWVLRHSPATLGDRLVLIVLADHASNDGGDAYPSVKTIADEAKLSERQAHRCLRDLEQSGQIERQGTGPRGVVIYRVKMYDKTADLPMTSTAKGVSQMSYKPSLTVEQCARTREHRCRHAYCALTFPTAHRLTEHYENVHDGTQATSA